MDFIRGVFHTSKQPQGTLEVRSPADQSDIVGVHTWHLAHVDEAVAAARAAFPFWRRLKHDGRAQYLRAYQVCLKTHADELAKMIAREVGKPLWEAKTEVQSMIGKVDLSLGEGFARTQDVQIANLPGEIRYKPHGVTAVIGPFNLPAHLPNGQIIPALLMGNTVVFKPSDKAPGTAELMARCFAEADFPEGVFNVVQGESLLAHTLVTHDDIDAIFFTGSASVGQHIVAANVHRPGLLIALELGGKNASLVFDDCQLDDTVRQLAFSGFATAGQRCTSSSRILVTKGIADRLCERLTQVADSIVVGHPFDEGVFMGPLISENSRQRLLDAQQKAQANGFKALTVGGACEVRSQGWYVRPAVHRAENAQPVAGYTDTELFAPDLAVQVVSGVDEAIFAANDTKYGLSSAVFTSSRHIFETCADGLRTGILHWNRSSTGASGRLPFGGIKASGNHRAAGIFMGASCVYPLSVLLPAQIQTTPLSWPGIHFD